MATASFNAKVLASGIAKVVSKSDPIGSVATVVTDDTATLAAIDAVGAAIIAISGDHYTAHQYVEDGATGLTSGQLHTIMTLMNTANTDFLAGQAAAVAAAAAGPLGGVNVSIDLASITTRTQLRAALDAVMLHLQGSNLLTP